MSKLTLLILLALATVLMLAASIEARRTRIIHVRVKRDVDEGEGEGEDDDDDDEGLESRTINGVKVTTHAPKMDKKAKAAEKKTNDVDLSLQAILALPASKVPDAIKKGIKAIQGYAGKLDDVIQKALDLIAAGVQPGIEMATAFCKNVVSLMGKAGGEAKKLKDKVVDALNPVVDFLVKGKGTLGSVIKDTMKKLDSMADLLAEQVVTFAAWLVGGLNKIVNLINDSAIFKLSVTARVVKQSIAKLVGWMKKGHSLLTDALENVLEQFQGVAVAFLDSLRNMISYASKEVSPILSHLVNLLGTLGAHLGKAFDKIVSGVYKVASGITSSLGLGK